MPLAPPYGHEDVRRVLARSAAAGELPHSLLLHGPAGVGKERTALWLAQLLLCEAPAEGEPCGACRACRLALRLEHPDLHWFFPLPRPDNASTPEKLREKLEEARAAELAERRADPHRVAEWEKPPAHYLAAVQNLQRHAAVRPSMGRRKVFVVGDAEAMVPQESSPEAANAFLKLLEEPPADTTLLLTSSQPGALLPTILSRVLPVRLLPLPDEAVAAFLEREAGAPAEEARRVAAAARGSVGRALRLRAGGGGDGPLGKRLEAGRALLRAAVADSPAARLAVAHAESPAGARGGLTETLDAFALWLRDLMAVASGAPEEATFAGAPGDLETLVRRRGIGAPGAASALLRVEEARALAAGNVNPQLVVAELLRGVRSDLLGVD